MQDKFFDWRIIFVLLHFILFLRLFFFSIQISRQIGNNQVLKTASFKLFFFRFLQENPRRILVWFSLKKFFFSTVASLSESLMSTFQRSVSYVTFQLGKKSCTKRGKRQFKRPCTLHFASRHFTSASLMLQTKPSLRLLIWLDVWADSVSPYRTPAQLRMLLNVSHLVNASRNFSKKKQPKNWNAMICAFTRHNLDLMVRDEVLPSGFIFFSHFGLRQLAKKICFGSQFIGRINFNLNFWNE